MKIKKTLVFVCDVNNVLLMIASQLYKCGVAVRYVPDLRLNQHFRIWDAPIDAEYGPENFCDFDISENLDKSLIFYKSPEDVKNLLNSIIGSNSIVIGSDYAPAIFEYAGLKLDYFATTGADVNSYTLISRFTRLFDVKQAFFNRNKNYRLFKRIEKSFNSVNLPTLQRRGISNAGILINSDYFNWKPLEKVQYTVVPYPLPGASSDLPGSAEKALDFSLRNTLNKIRTNTDLLVLNISKNDFWKGTHTFFEGFKSFKSKTKLSTKLLIFGRGNLSALRRKYTYVDDFIKSGDIIILPPVSQKDVENIISYCDICLGGICDENYLFDWNTSLMQYAIKAKPVITYSPFEGHFSGFHDIPIYPHVSARTADEVCAALMSLESEQLRGKYSAEMSAWVKAFTDKSLQKWLEVLK